MRSVILFCDDQTVTLKMLSDCVVGHSQKEFGGRWPETIVAPASVVRRWMGEARGDFLIGGPIWTHLYAAKIEPGFPVSIHWELPETLGQVRVR